MGRREKFRRLFSFVVEKSSQYETVRREMAALFSIVASITSKHPLVSDLIANPVALPPFFFADAFQGAIEVVTETDNPSAPTAALPIDASTGVVLSDGISVIYANAVIIGIVNSNVISFTMTVSSQALLDALDATTEDYINAFFEARISITAGGQNELLLREPCLIMKSSSIGGAIIPAVVPGVIFNYNIDGLRGTANPITAIPTAALATFVLLIAVITSGGIRSQSTWQLLGGAADPTDLNGQVAPADYNAVTNNRFWQRVS